MGVFCLLHSSLCLGKAFCHFPFPQAVFVWFLDTCMKVLTWVVICALTSRQVTECKSSSWMWPPANVCSMALIGKRSPGMSHVWTQSEGQACAWEDVLLSSVFNSLISITSFPKTAVSPSTSFDSQQCVFQCKMGCGPSCLCQAGCKKWTLKDFLHGL